jgi:hypothetical protein
MRASIAGRFRPVLPPLSGPHGVLKPTDFACEGLIVGPANHPPRQSDEQNPRLTAHAIYVSCSACCASAGGPRTWIAVAGARDRTWPRILAISGGSSIQAMTCRDALMPRAQDAQERPPAACRRNSGSSRYRQGELMRSIKRGCPGAWRTRACGVGPKSSAPAACRCPPCRARAATQSALGA